MVKTARKHTGPAPGSTPRPARPGAAPAPAARARNPIKWHAALVVAVALAVFANTLTLGFVWDDSVIVLAGHRIHHLSEIPSLFTSHAFSGAGDLAARREQVIEYYRPMWTLSLSLDTALWKQRALGYHLTNVLLHAAAALAALLLARALLVDPILALLAALAFAVHPVHTEAVAWVSSRNELLAGLFLFLAMLGYVRWRARGSPHFAALSLVAFVLALLSKETAVTFPALALLYETRPGRDARRGAWFVGPLVLGVVALAYLALRHALVHDLPETHSVASRLMTSPVLVARYLWLLFLPISVKVFYPVSVVTSVSLGLVVGALVVIGVIVAALALRKRAPDAFFGLGWILITLLPVAGLVAFLKPALMADRYLYIPSFGAGLAVAALIGLAARNLTPRGARATVPTAWIAAAAIVLAILGIATLRQNMVWKSDRTLMTRMIHDAPDVPIGHMNLAVAEHHDGHVAAAEREFERARALDPRDHSIRRNLAIFYHDRRRYADAEREYRAALALKSDDVDSRYGLGAVLAEQGKVEDGIRELEAARTLRPDDPDTYVALGAAYESLGRPDDAMREYRQALKVDPQSAGAHSNYGMLELKLGHPDVALSELTLACRLNPENADYRFNLAAVHTAAGRHADAERELRAAVASRPDWAEAHDNLGIALARQKRFREAVTELETAVRLAPDNAAIQRNLALARRDAAATPGAPPPPPGTP